MRVRNRGAHPPVAGRTRCFSIRRGSLPRSCWRFSCRSSSRSAMRRCRRCRSSASVSSSPNVWNPVTSEFGALAPIYGTLVTSAIALLIGVPVSFGIALFLTEMCPAALKRPLGTAVELLAAIPSIIYGMWGLFVFAPFFADHVQPLLTRALRRCLADRSAVPGRADRARRADGGHHPGNHGHSVHRVGDARRLRGRAARS